MFVRILPLLILLLLLISCSKGSSSSSKRDTPIEETEIQEVLANQNFECASLGGRCPEGISRVFIINPSNPELSGVCTGFMVSPTRLVTNHHCISDEVACRTTFIATYNGNGHESARCKSIIKSEQDSDDPNDPTRTLDYTVMELDKPFQGEFFSLSDTLASPNDEINVWVIDHTGIDEFPSNLLNSRITEFECSVSPERERASLLMLKCPIISGNSGSPALNRQGNVIGVIWGGSLGSTDSSLDLDVRRQLDEVGLATEVNYFRDVQVSRD